MRTLSRLMAFCVAAPMFLAAGSVTLDFNVPGLGGVNQEYPVVLDDYYLGGTIAGSQGTNYGIHGIRDVPSNIQFYNDLHIWHDAMQTPLHNNGALISDGGFQGWVGYDYFGTHAPDGDLPQPVLEDANHNAIPYTLNAAPGSTGESGQLQLVFSGVAYYLFFGPPGSDRSIYSFDNLTFSDLIGYDQSGPVTATPEPCTFALILGAGLLATRRLLRPGTVCG